MSLCVAMPNFLELAKNGNTNAIEALINKSFGSQGVIAHINKTESTLKIALETPSKPGPDKTLVIRLKAGLNTIKPNGVDKVFVSAKTLNSDQLLWYSQWELNSSKKTDRVAPSQVPNKSQVLYKQKRAMDFKVKPTRERPYKWVVLSLSGVATAMGLGIWWFFRSEIPTVSQTSSAPSTIVVASTPQTSPEPAATPNEIQVFSKLVILIDPEQSAITQVQQGDETELLYLTVGQGFLAETKSNQGDLAIRLRDAWNKICDCYGQLIFQSAGGQELVYIATDEPKFKPE